MKIKPDSIAFPVTSSRVLMFSGMITVSFSMIFVPIIAKSVVEALSHHSFFQPARPLSLFIAYGKMRFFITGALMALLIFAEFNMKNRTTAQLLHLFVIWGTFFLGFTAFLLLSFPLLPFDRIAF